MNRLSEAEREALAKATGHESACIVDWPCVTCDALGAVVEAIVAARLASVEALADEWESLGDTDSAFWWSTLATHLRAVLGSDAHTEQKGNGRMSYDDDRPGMMRIHIAERRADALCRAYTRWQLRCLARGAGVSTAYRLKRDLAFHVACAGVVAPGYDKAVER